MDQRLSLTDVLGTTGRVMAGNLPAFFVTAALFTAPVVALEAWLIEWRIAARPDAHAYYASDDALLRASVLAMLATGLVGAFGVAATQAGVLYGVVEQLAGRAPGIGAAIGKPLARMPAAIGAMLLVSCVVLFGSTCLVVPAIVLASLFYFAIPAAVIEELPPFRAVARSVDLTKGNRALVLCLVGSVVAIFGGARLALRALFDAPPLLALETSDLPASGPAWGYFALLALASIFEAMTLAVLSSVAYARLRARDGIDVDALAEVFA